MNIAVKIFVCCHKNCKVPSDKMFFPIHVGKETSDCRLPFLGDNTGDNISSLNKNYCELTGTFWIWKNVQADFVGICHYRRYYSFFTPTKSRDFFKGLYHKISRFANSFSDKIKEDSYYTSSFSVVGYESLKNNLDAFQNDISSFIEKNNVKLFALKPICSGNVSNKRYFGVVAGYWHIDVLNEYIKNKYNAYYPFFSHTLKSNKLYYANMIIARHDIFNEYCSFIFDVLDYHYKLCLSSNMYKSHNEKSLNRLSGYLGELLTSTFVSYVRKSDPKSVKLLSQIQYTE